MKATIENYLLALTNHLYQGGEPFSVHPSDEVILFSIARQVSKDIALTDRQYELLREKLEVYRDQFERNNMNDLTEALENLSMPMRQINRDKTITLDNETIVVKFPFKKSTIQKLSNINTKYNRFRAHVKGTQEHCYNLYEPLIVDLIDEFKDSSFVIDKKIMDLYNQLKPIQMSPENYIPEITNNGLRNVHEAALELAEKEIGAFSPETFIKYVDRAARYGYAKSVFKTDNISPTTAAIINRTEPKVYIDPIESRLSEVAKSIIELDRFPLLISLTPNFELSELLRFVQEFSTVSLDQQIVLNRAETTIGQEYSINTYIKENNFNKWLDGNIKIAYIFRDKLPKILVKNEWKPIAHLSMSGERLKSIVGTYVYEHCDLNIAVDRNRSSWDEQYIRQLNQW